LLAALDVSHRLLGAEINSIASLVKSDRISTACRLVFLLSETGEGNDTGTLLTHYFTYGSSPLHFAGTSCKTIAGLQDGDFKRFRNEGLKNLVREIVAIYRAHSGEKLSINATGGYKAQISFAGLIGQALQLPIYYMFEKFSEIIEMPPQPVSLDLDLWLGNYELLSLLSRTRSLGIKELEEQGFYIEKVDPRIAALLDILDDGLVALSPVGELFYETKYLQWHENRQREATMPPTPANRDDPRAPNSQINRSPHIDSPMRVQLLSLLGRVFDDVDYVTGFYSYKNNEHLPGQTKFKLSSDDNKHVIDLHYGYGKGTCYLRVGTTPDATLNQLKNAVVDLNERLLSWP